MTRRTVIWVPEAEDELGEIWLAADDRDAVASAADTTDSVLKATPRFWAVIWPKDSRDLIASRCECSLKSLKTMHSYES